MKRIKRKRRGFRFVLCAILAVTMVMSMAPILSFAEEQTQEQQVQIAEEPAALVSPDDKNAAKKQESEGTEEQKAKTDAETKSEEVAKPNKTNVNKAPAKGPAAGSPEIYLNPSGGNDSWDGTSTGTAVKTLGKANELIRVAGGEGTIIVMGALSADGTQYDFGDKDKVTIRRNSGYHGAIFNDQANIKNVTIDGQSNIGSALFNAGSWWGGFTVENVDVKDASAGVFNLTGVWLNISGDCKFSNNICNGHGGVIRGNYGSVKINDNSTVTFENNKANGSGGAIYLDNGSLHIAKNAQVTFKGNQAQNGNGGAVYVNHNEHWHNEHWRTTELHNTVFEDNSATNFGGAVYRSGSAGDFSTDGGMFKDNSARNGGAVYIAGGTHKVTLKDTTFEGNKATGNPSTYGAGGAVEVTGDNDQRHPVVVDGSTFKDNKGTNRGGALFLQYVDSAEIKDSTFTGNTSNPDMLTLNENGGAIALNEPEQRDTKITISDSEFNENKAGGYGGAVYVHGNPQAENSNVPTLTVKGGTFEANESNLAGGGISLENANVVIDKSDNGDTTLLKGNKAGISGGGLFTEVNEKFPGTVTADFKAVDVIDNEAVYYGGGMSLGGFRQADPERFKIQAEIGEATITGNQVTAGDDDAAGGGVYVHNDAVLQMKDALIQGNEATNHGGGIYTCPNGVLMIAPKDGGAIFDNKAGSVDAPYQDIAHLKALESQLVENMLGGGVHNWDSITKEITYSVYDSDGSTTPYTVQVVYAGSDPKMMESDIEKALTAENRAIADAKIKITGNKATAGSGTDGIAEAEYKAGGGGIAVNGVLMLGDFQVNAFQISKQDPSGKPLEGVKFSITGETTDGQDYEAVAYSNKEGKVIFPAIPYGIYTLNEVEALEGYTSGHKVYTLRVTGDGVTVYDEEDGKEVTTKVAELTDEEVTLPVGVFYSKLPQLDVENAEGPEEKIELKVAKNWHVDENTVQEGLIFPVRLYWGPDENTQYDTGQTVWLSASGDWKGSFGEWPKYWDEDQKTETVYTVMEIGDDGIPARAGRYVHFFDKTHPVSYESTATKDTARVEEREEKLVAHNGPTIQISGEKLWDDEANKEGLRPDAVTLHVKADGKEIAQVELSEKNNWQFTLYGFDKDGKPVFENNGFLISQPLYEYNNGKEISYTIEEDTVTGYTAAVTKERKELTQDSGEELDNDKIEELDEPIESDYFKVDTAAALEFKVTNTHTPKAETVDVPVAKVWDDRDDEYGERPDRLTVHLLANGKKTDKSLTLNEGNEWKSTFKDLPKKDDKGQDITYTVSEDVAGEYALISTKNVKGTETLTNVYRPWGVLGASDGYANLTLQKKAKGLNSDLNFTFTVQIGDYEETVNLKAGEELTYDYIPVGKEIRVTEKNASDYDVSYRVGGETKKKGTKMEIASIKEDTKVTFTNAAKETTPLKKITTITRVKRAVKTGDPMALGLLVAMAGAGLAGTTFATKRRRNRA